MGFEPKPRLDLSRVDRTYKTVHKRLLGGEDTGRAMPSDYTPIRGMELAAIVNDVVQAPKLRSWPGDEGAAGGEDLVREVHAAFKDDVFGSNSDDGGQRHRRSTITHDAALPGAPIVDLEPWLVISNLIDGSMCGTPVVKNSRHRGFFLVTFSS